MQITDTVIYSDNIETEYLQATSLAHRKKFAQFFTPQIVAELMTKWLLGNPNLQTVLEPAFGLGIFSRILLQSKPSLNIKGFEVDSNILQRSQALFSNQRNVDLHLKDYIYSDWEYKYDGIICNPPYFKFHDYDNKNILKEIETKISFRLNGFTNLYALFLLKSLYQLNKNGRAAYIIPSEFLNSDYGVLVKSYLLKNKSLRHVIVIDFEKNVFENALTTASILLFANDDKAEGVQFSNITTLDDLSKIEQLIEDYPTRFTAEQFFKFEILAPEVKWRSYYQKQNSSNYKKLAPFSKYGKVMRGIATGANDYFTFNISKAKRYGIDEKYLLPCICKAVDAKSPFFTEENFTTLKKSDKSVFLLSAVNSINDAVRNYLEKGIAEEIHKKFLTASRKIWYSLENRPPAPIWVTVFNRNGLRFIRNEANISNLTTFHCIYPNIFSHQKIDLLFAYLISDVSKQIFNDNRREYGNGLQKFEPNDINKAQILDIELIKESSEKKILELYRNYRNTIISDEPNEGLLTEMNEIFIESLG